MSACKFVQFLMINWRLALTIVKRPAKQEMLYPSAVKSLHFSLGHRYLMAWNISLYFHLEIFYIVNNYRCSRTKSKTTDSALYVQQFVMQSIIRNFISFFDKLPLYAANRVLLNLLFCDLNQVCQFVVKHFVLCMVFVLRRVFTQFIIIIFII